MRKTITLSLVLALAVFSLSSCSGGDDKKPGQMPSDSLKTAVTKSLDGFSMQLMMNPIDTATMFNTLQAYLEANPGIYGTAFALVPVVNGKDTLRFSPYVYRNSQGYQHKYINKSYDYTKDSWYTGPVSSKKGFWTEAYFDKGGGEAWMITYSLPLYTTDSVLVGVVTSDLELKK